MVSVLKNQGFLGCCPIDQLAGRAFPSVRLLRYCARRRRTLGSVGRGAHPLSMLMLECRDSDIYEYFSTRIDVFGAGSMREIYVTPA